MNGPLTGQQEGVENRVYHAAMAPDTSTPPRAATPVAFPEFSTAERPTSTATTAMMAAGASETTTLAGAEHESAIPPQFVEPADLDLLGNRIAELSARIQAATYELLCYLRVCRATDYAA